MLPRNATIPVSRGCGNHASGFGVKALADGPGWDFADFRNLAGCKDLFHLEDSTRPVWCETTEVSSSLRIAFMSAR